MFDRLLTLTVAASASRSLPDMLPGFIRRALRLFEVQTVLFVGVLMATLFLVLFPVVLLIFYSFSVGTPAEPLRLGFDAWRHAVDKERFRTALRPPKFLCTPRS